MVKVAAAEKIVAEHTKESTSGYIVLNNIHFHRQGNSIMHRCVILVEICPILRQNFLLLRTLENAVVISIKSFKYARVFYWLAKPV